MAIHDEAGVGRRKLDMVEPVGRGDHHLALPGADIDGEDLHRDARFQPFIEAHFLRLGKAERFSVRAVGGIIGLAELLLDLRRGALLGAVGLERLVARRPLAEQQRLVRIDRADRTAIDGRDLAHLAAVDVGGIERRRAGAVVALVAGIIGGARLAPGEEQLDILALDQRPDAPVGQRQHRNAVGGGDHHLVALRRIAVLVEIEAGAARHIGQSQHAVAGGLVDPFGHGLGQRRGRRAHRQRRHQAHHHRLHLMALHQLAASASASGMSARFSIAARPHCDAALVETSGHSTIGRT